MAKLASPHYDLAISAYYSYTEKLCSKRKPFGHMKETILDEKKISLDHSYL